MFVISKLISVGDNTVKIWDAVSGDIKNTLQGHSREVTSVAISPDGSTIVSGSREYSRIVKRIPKLKQIVNVCKPLINVISYFLITYFLFINASLFVYLFVCLFVCLFVISKLMSVR